MAPVEPIGGLLFVEHIAQIGTEWRRKKMGDPNFRPMSESTIHDYCRWSQEGGRLAHHPVPEAKARRRSRQPAWYAEQEKEWIKWFEERPGRGAGGGRPKGSGKKNGGKSTDGSK